MLKDPAVYRARAALRTEKADDAKTAATKEYWCRMAENWLKLAQSKERTQKRE
jgi:hypothetical protein